MSVGTFVIPALAQRTELSAEVQRRVISADTQTFVIALVVIVGAGFELVNPGTGQDVKLVLAGFIGAVVQFFFQNKTAATTAAATIAAQQQGSNASGVASAQGASQGGKP